MRWILALVLMIGAAAAQAQMAGVTLPADGRMMLWDMGTMPPRPLTAPLPAAIGPGRCYVLQGGSLHLQATGGTCLDYYIYRGAVEGLPPISATGRIGFNHLPPDQLRRGLQLNGVTGITDCGARTDCQTLFISGFTTRALAFAAMAAAREGREVTLKGRELWHRESRDIIVEAITP